MGRTELLARGCGQLTSPDLNTYDLYLWVKLESVANANNPHDLEALKRNIREAIYYIQQQVPRNLFKRIQACSQQRVDILNIFYGGEYNNNYYI
jgi:hypothetical protein